MSAPAVTTGRSAQVLLNELGGAVAGRGWVVISGLAVGLGFVLVHMLFPVDPATADARAAAPASLAEVPTAGAGGGGAPDAPRPATGHDPALPDAAPRPHLSADRVPNMAAPDTFGVAVAAVESSPSTGPGSAGSHVLAVLADRSNPVRQGVVLRR